MAHEQKLGGLPVTGRGHLGPVQQWLKIECIHVYLILSREV